MALAQAMNYRLGFAVWPMGEDRNWIDILQNRGPFEAAKAFWQIDDRNPLAPWWYIALRPIILRYDSGLFLIRETVGLTLGLSSYMFLFVMTRTRTFALGTACVVAVFLGNGYIEQVYWTMQVALILSLCSLTLYQLSVERRPTDHTMYAGAIVAWFFALGTYSVQAGGLLGIAFLALTAPATTMSARVRRTVVDTLPFAAIFVAFWLEWQTTARNLYVTRWHMQEAIASIKQAFWHFDYMPFFEQVVYPALSYRLVYALSGAVVAVFVFRELSRSNAESPPTLPSWERLTKTVITAGCLMFPVVAVEASRHGIPGEGWRKVYQFTIPFLYLSIAATLLALLPTKAGGFSWRVAAASLAGLATATTLGMNRLQVEVTRSEKMLRTGLLQLAQENLNEGQAPPYQFLVRRGPEVDWYASDVLSPAYARTFNFPQATSYRFLPGADITDPRFAMRFKEDGVENGALDGRTIGNAHVFFVSATSEGIRRLCSVGPEGVKSPVVEWQRSSALESRVGDCGRSSRSSP
jgi:hypothetical protein